MVVAFPDGIAVCGGVAGVGPVTDPVRSGREGEGCRDDLTVVVAFLDG